MTTWFSLIPAELRNLVTQWTCEIRPILRLIPDLVSVLPTYDQDEIRILAKWIGKHGHLQLLKYIQVHESGRLQERINLSCITAAIKAGQSQFLRDLRDLMDAESLIDDGIIFMISVAYGNLSFLPDGTNTSDIVIITGYKSQYRLYYMEKLVNKGKTLQFENLAKWPPDPNLPDDTGETSLFLSHKCRYLNASNCQMLVRLGDMDYFMAQWPYLKPLLPLHEYVGYQFTKDAIEWMESQGDRRWSNFWKSSLEVTKYMLKHNIDTYKLDTSTYVYKQALTKVDR